MHSSIVNGQPWQYNASIALFTPQAPLPSKKLKHMQHLQRHKNQSLSQDYPILQHCIPNLHLNTLSNPQSHASKEPFSCHMNMTSTIRPFISLPISPLCCVNFSMLFKMQVRLPTVDLLCLFIAAILCATLLSCIQSPPRLVWSQWARSKLLALPVSCWNCFPMLWAILAIHPNTS